MLDLRATLDKLLELQVHGGSGVSVGTITEYAGAFPPDGWIICDGRTLSRTVYAELFNEIGTTWGAGDGSTTFNIPDLRDKFSVGTGGLYSLTNSGGNKDSVIPYHNHDVNAVTSIGPSTNSTSNTGDHEGHLYSNGSNLSGGNVARYLQNTSLTAYGSSGRGWNQVAGNEMHPVGNTRGSHTHTLNSHTHQVPSHTTEYAGTSGNLTNANLPPYLAMNFIIFTGVFQTLTAQTTWTLLEDRIQNSQLNIAIPSFFDEPITIDDDIKIKINQNVTTGVDYELNNSINILGWSDLVTNSQLSFKGILSRMAYGAAIAGTIMEYAGAFPPDGWVICDGRALSRTVYEELFDAIGTTYGSGDGSTTFNIPDFRGRVATGVGTCDGVTYTLGDKKTAGIPNITGYIKSSNSSVYQSAWENDGSVTKGGVFNTSTWATRNGFPDSSGNYSSIAQLNFDASQSNSHYGASTTVQPNTTVINYIIFTGIYQTVAVARTWTSLQDRISNSQLHIPVVTNFNENVTFNNSWTAGNNFSITNAAAFRNALDVAQKGAYGFQKAPGGYTFDGSTTTRSMSVSVTTHGRPVFIMASGDLNPTTADAAWFYTRLYRGSTMLCHQICEVHGNSWNNPFAISYLDTVAAGTYTYRVEFARGAGTFTLTEGGQNQSPNFVVFEI